MDCVGDCHAGCMYASQVDHELKVSQTFRLAVIAFGTVNHVLEKIQRFFVSFTWRCLLLDPLLDYGYKKLLGSLEVEVGGPR
jgi:hypothetical protein